MRSAKAFAGSIILLAGVPIALLSAILLNAGDSEIIHLALGLSFALFALAAASDFCLLQWMRLVAATGIGVLAVIFLLQCAADLTHLPWLINIAYAGLGQTLEKALGYVFLAWCIAILIHDSYGWTRTLGVALMALVLGIEIYTYAAPYFGATANDALKLIYVPLFVWLLLESLKPRSHPLRLGGHL